MSAQRGVLERFAANHVPVPEAGCWLWIGDCGGRRGYGRMRVGGGRCERAHRLSYSIHRGSIPPGMCVCHRCDTPSCVNPDHLFLATNEENTADRVAKGRSRGGRLGARNPVKHSRHHKAKLSEAQVSEIRALAAKGGTSQDAIAARFGISQSNVSLIVRGDTWYSGRRSKTARMDPQPGDNT